MKPEPLLKIKAAPVRLEGVTKRFGRDVIAVNNIDLNVAPGQLVTLLGPSGCGKTTTLRMIAGLERATSGAILIGNEDVTRLPANLRDVTMVFQSYALFPHMNVFHNVGYGLSVSKKPKDEIKARVMVALEMVGLTGLESRPTNALSGGQQQRVALARALVMEPQVLLFDEPLSNLDAKLRRRVREEIRALQQRLGITSVYVTHDQEEALAISDVIVVMNHGRIEQIGAPHELYTQPRSRFVADFIGSANFLSGHNDGTHVTLGAYRFPFKQALAPGAVTVMVRPEAIEIAPEGLEATVESSAYLGSSTDLNLMTAAGELHATLFGEGLIGVRRGDRIHVRFKTTGVYLLQDNAPSTQTPHIHTVSVKG